MVVLILLCVTCTNIVKENRGEPKQKVLVEYVIYAPTKELHKSTIIRAYGNKFESYCISSRGTNDVYVKDVSDGYRWKIFKQTIFPIYSGTNDCIITNIKILDDND